MVGVAEEAEVEESVTLFVEDSEAPVVVEETVLCSAEFVEREEEGEEPEVEEAVLVTLPEPEAVVVDGVPAFENDQQ